MTDDEAAASLPRFVWNEKDRRHNDDFTHVGDWMETLANTIAYDDWSYTPHHDCDCWGDPAMSHQQTRILAALRTVRAQAREEMADEIVAELKAVVAHCRAELGPSREGEGLFDEMEQAVRRLATGAKP